LELLAAILRPFNPGQSRGDRVASRPPTHYIGAGARFMRAEIENLVEEIKQSASLLRRHL
jgi:hypothetical protein